MIGEFIGSTTVVLFAIALIVATRARWLEPWFGGLDKMYRTHRETAVVGFALLVGHVALIPWRLTPGGGVPSGVIAFVGFTVMVTLSVAPRVPGLRRVFSISYGSWRLSHRFIGFFFFVSLAHLMLVDPLVRTAPGPFILLMTAYVLGTAAFLYSLLLARFVRRRRPHVVETARRLNETTVEVGLRPRRNGPLPYRSGQFVFVTFRRWRLREPHPFTIGSAPDDPLLRLTVKVSGGFTRRLYERVEPGIKATVEGSYGTLDYRRGRRDQIWIAAGIGVTPFLSWCRDLADDADHRIDFFYTARHPDDALFWNEIETRIRSLPRLRAHLNISSRTGTLTVPRIASLSRFDLSDIDVFMCGPVPMIHALERGFRRAGVPAAHIHFEEFSFR